MRVAVERRDFTGLHQGLEPVQCLEHAALVAAFGRSAPSAASMTRLTSLPNPPGTG